MTSPRRRSPPTSPRSTRSSEAALFGMLVEQPSLDADAGPIGAVIGLFGFELSPPHADLLGRIAQIAGAARAPFIAAIGPDALKTAFHDQHRLIREAWTALGALPASVYLGLATPRFLLRMPYGARPIRSMCFPSRSSRASPVCPACSGVIPA